MQVLAFTTTTTTTTNTTTNTTTTTTVHLSYLSFSARCKDLKYSFHHNVNCSLLHYFSDYFCGYD